MQPPVLFGEYELVIDPQCRLTLPAELRRVIIPEVHGAAFFAITGENRKLCLYPEKSFEALHAERTQLQRTEELEFDAVHFALAIRLEPDNRGRILLPKDLVRDIGLVRQVTLLGVRDHLEIWNRDDWNNHLARLLSPMQRLPFSPPS